MGLDPDCASDDRKFRRDLAGLRASGWRITPVTRGLEHRYVLRVIDPRLARAFTPEQRGQLLRAAQRARIGQVYDDLDPAHADDHPHEGVDSLGVVQHAIRYRCVLRFDYHGRARRLHPDDVFHSGGAWFVRGREDGAVEDVKMFRLDRAEDVRVEPPGSADPARDLPPPNRDPLRRAERSPVTVLVQTTEEDLPDVVHRIGVQGYRRLDSPTDGHVRLEVTVTNVTALLTRILELDTRVRLLGPASVRDRLETLLRAAIAGAS
jgi:predicted DNA-binding transcriptional regulator YafY